VRTLLYCLSRLTSIEELYIEMDEYNDNNNVIIDDYDMENNEHYDVLFDYYTAINRDNDYMIMLCSCIAQYCKSIKRFEFYVNNRSISLNYIIHMLDRCTNLTKVYLSKQFSMNLIVQY
jgi:hypothetical protein